MLGVELARGRADAAFEHARAMLDPFQQPLPSQLQSMLARAVETGDASLLVPALELATAGGYA
jgi:hypothetical protein